MMTGRTQKLVVCLLVEGLMQAGLYQPPTVAAQSDEQRQQEEYQRWQAEQRRQWQEELRREQARKAQEREEAQKRQQEERRLAEEKRQAEEQARLAAEERAEAERQRQAAEAQRAEEQRLAAEAKRLAEEQRLAEAAKQAEAERIEAQQRQEEEQKLAAQKRQAEEQARLAAEERAEAERQRQADLVRAQLRLAEQQRLEQQQSDSRRSGVKNFDWQHGAYRESAWRQIAAIVDGKLPWRWRETRYALFERLAAAPVQLGPVYDRQWSSRLPGLHADRWHDGGQAAADAFWYRGKRIHDAMLFYDDRDELSGVGLLWNDAFVFIRDNNAVYQPTDAAWLEQAGALLKRPVGEPGQRLTVQDGAVGGSRRSTGVVRISTTMSLRRFNGMSPGVTCANASRLQRTGWSRSIITVGIRFFQACGRKNGMKVMATTRGIFGTMACGCVKRRCFTTQRKSLSVWGLRLGMFWFLSGMMPQCIIKLTPPCWGWRCHC